MFTMNGWLGGAVRKIKQSAVAVLLAAIGLLVQTAGALAISTTTVQGTVFLANGEAGSGTLHLSWPMFTTASGQAVAADSMTVAIAPDGFVSVNLAPNLGATPAGLYYTAVFYMSDGTVSTQYWVVPSAAQASLAQVQSKLMPAAQAVQAVSKAYVDQSISELSQSLLTATGGTLSGPLYLNGDPTQALQAADKHYVDTAVSQAVPLAGGNMTGALTSPTVNGVQAPTASSSQTTLQAAMTAAGTNGALVIPPTYAGTDGFANPNGVRVTDLRATGAQQTERSVKEFGAVCDGVTDDTNALQQALNYAQAHGVALTIPQGTCKTKTLNWHGESIGGMGKQVSALLGFPGQDVLASMADSPNLLQYTRLHDLTIYVDQSMDVSCSPAEGRAAAGSCAISRPVESNSIFSHGGNGLNGTAGTGPGWYVGNCAIAMPAVLGTGGNGLRVAEIENLEIATTGVDPMAAQFAGIQSTHTCGMYLAQWPRWSEFRNIDLRGLNTAIAIPALPGATPTGLNADSNRWQKITMQATHGFTAATGSNNVLDDVVAMSGNSSAAGEPPTGLVLDLDGSQQGWTVRNAVVIPSWNAVQPQLTVTAAGGAVTVVTVGSEHGQGFDSYGAQIPLQFSGSCTAAAVANVNTDGSIGAINVTQGGTGCSGTTVANVNAAGTWDAAAAVNLIGGQSMTFFGGNLLKGNGGYTVWNASGSESYGTQLNGGGGTQPGGGTYAALVGNNHVGTMYEVDQFPGTDFGAKLQSCLSAVSAIYGGDCDARNFTGNLLMSSNLTISTANTTIQLPCATISTANQIIVTAGTRNATLRGCALRGGSAASGSQGGTAFAYSGTSAFVQVGDPTYAVDTQGFHLDDVVINTTSATSTTAQGLAAYRTQEMDLESLYFLGNANQTGMTLDGTENYTGGTYLDDAFNGFQTAINAIGHQVSNSATTDWMNASSFVRLHIDCPTSGGGPIAGTYGINLRQGDGNTFTGGDVEGCATALHLGPNAQNNTIVGLRNENSTHQVVADAGSAYNNWITGGTMFTGQLTDSGTHNSFWDTFHYGVNALNGDVWRAQADQTLTNHIYTGIGLGNVRGRQDEWVTDTPGAPNSFQNAWLWGPGDGTAGQQTWVLQDLLNNISRFGVQQYTTAGGNNQTYLNSAGTGAVVLNGSNNAGTGGVVIGSGGPSMSVVATVGNTGNALFTGTLQVGGPSTFSGTTTVKNQADAEIDQVLWAGTTTPQKESLTYKDWNGNNQWYLVKDASNNLELNSATGGLDSFKAYQSTNSGDTYLNASSGSGAVRVNYESGSGTQFKVYGGNSGAVYASFTGATSIQFPGLAAGSGHDCLQVDDSGYLSNTGTGCGSASGMSYPAAGVGVSTGSGWGSSLPAPSSALVGVSDTQTLTNKSINATNVNGICTATQYGAVGDCTSSGSTTSCTDNNSASFHPIQDAIDACYATGGSVYFPINPSRTVQTVYYVSHPINSKGVSMFGPLGASGPVQSYSTTHSVVIRGAPGQDVFHVTDIADSGYVAPRYSYTIQDLAVLVDASTDVSSSFSNRRPGRTCKDVVANGTTTVTSATQCEFQPGDVGQAITVNGTTTTISYWNTVNSVTLATTISSGTGLSAYISVMGLPVNQNIGNCGFAYDDRTGAASFGNGPTKALFKDFIINTVNGVAGNHACGFFFQGNQAPSWSRWENVSASGGGMDFGFSFVPVSAVAPTSTMYTGIADFNKFDHIYIDATYPFLCYSCELQDLHGFQLFSQYGPQFINAYGTVSATNSDDIDIPEEETNLGICASGNSFRIAGYKNKIRQLSLGLCNSSVIQWDASESSVEQFNIGGHSSTFNLTGNLNSFEMTDGAQLLPSYLTFAGTGAGNTFVTGTLWTPYNSVQPARKEYAYPGLSGLASSFGSPQLSRGSIVFNRTHDFIDKGAAAYYFNGEDMWLWPQEVGGNGVNIVLTPDSSSQSGFSFKIPGASSLGITSANQAYLYAGRQITAGKMRIYFLIKSASSLNVNTTIQANETGSWVSIASCPNFSGTATSYALEVCDVDATGLDGDQLSINFSNPGADVQVAWIGIRPWYSDLPTNSLQLGAGTVLTANHGTGTSVQHSDGTGTSGACFFSADGSCTATAGALQNGTTATTQTAGDNSNKIATTAYVAAAIPSSLPPNGSAGGDLSGSYPSPTVAKINGAAVPSLQARLASDSSGHIVAASNTLGCLDGYDHLPCTVFVQSNISESTQSGSYATVWTSSYAGTYRITGYIYGTTVSSTAYSVSNYVKATQTGQSSGNGYLVGSAQIGTSISSNNAYAYVFPLSAGTAVQTESLTGSGSNTGGAWSRGIIVERLQ